MKSKDLSIVQRLAVSVLYIATIVLILRFFSHNFDFLSGGSPYGTIFVSAALLLVFGTYITEPYFTRPVDTITNSTAIILALVAVENKSEFIAYNQFLILTFLVLIFGLITVVFVKEPRPRWQRAIYLAVTRIGASKVAFSMMYVLTLLSFFTENTAEFWVLLTFLIILLSQFVYEDLVRFVTRMLRLFTTRNYDTTLLGVAIGKENPFLFKVQVDSTKVSSKAAKVGSLVFIQGESKKALLGVVANEKSLINGTWLTVYLLVSSGRALCFDFKTQKISKTDDLFSPNNHVFSLDIASLDQDTQKEILEDNIYKNSSQIVGYVAQGSNINRVKFETLPDLSKGGLEIQEGTIVQIKIGKDTCLYQIIDAQTDEEALEKHNSTGYTTGVAQKLGKYIKSTKELSVVKWLPEIYTPVYLATETKQRAFNELSIGVLPGTNLDISIKDADSIVTHNTAVLGILGIGKSSLAFELIQKVTTATPAKIICIDITNEHHKNIAHYIDSSLIQNDFDTETLKSLKTGSAKAGSPDKPSEWGNEKEYAAAVQKLITDFTASKKRVLILNPDLHAVSRPLTSFKISESTDLTVAQKTRIISERVFMQAKEKWTAEATTEPKEARYMIVYEEAHSLIPEWNSSANDGDQQASNGTAKVIMQGRKYGLGSLVITQRTANISKSILNQCNTIFALRVFDDTGKTFLENYVGSDYANALPTLEERHAVAVGKALALKQPIIIKLNDRESVTITKADTEKASKASDVPASVKAA